MGLFEPMHIVIIVLAALIFLGPKRIPEFMKGLGKGMGELQKGINEGKAALANAMNDVTSESPSIPSTPMAEHVVSATPVPEVHETHPTTDTVSETPKHA